MIYEINGHYVISSGHMWLPGCYESRATAQYAFQFQDEVLASLQESINPGGIITLAMLRHVRHHSRAEAKEPCDSGQTVGEIITQRC